MTSVMRLWSRNRASLRSGGERISVAGWSIVGESTVTGATAVVGILSGAVRMELDAEHVAGVMFIVKIVRGRQRRRWG